MYAWMVDMVDVDVAGACLWCLWTSLWIWCQAWPIPGSCRVGGSIRTAPHMPPTCEHAHEHESAATRDESGGCALHSLHAAVHAWHIHAQTGMPPAPCPAAPWRPAQTCATRALVVCAAPCRDTLCSVVRLLCAAAAVDAAIVNYTSEHWRRCCCSLEL